MASTFGINGRSFLPNDLFKLAQPYQIIGGTGYRNLTGLAVTTAAGNGSYSDGTNVGMNTDRKPTTFPPTGDLLFWLWSSFPAAAYGTYDVEFTPGLEWAWTGNGAGSRTAYDSAGGTATIVITAAGSVPTIQWTGYNGASRTLPAAASLYFHMWKRNADGTSQTTAQKAKLVAPEFKAALAPFAGGPLRFMEIFGTNRASTTGITYNSVTDTDLPAPSWITWNIPFDGGPPIEALIECCVDVGMVPWINFSDLASNAAITALATRVLAAMPSTMACFVERSNEMWQTGAAAFTQGQNLYDRSVSAGRSHTQQYAFEAQPLYALWQTAFAGQLSRLRLVGAWQAASSWSNILAMLDQSNFYQQLYGFAIAPYNGQGLGGSQYDLGNYSATAAAVQPFTQVNRDLILTDAAAFKVAAFACLTAWMTVTQAVYYAFVDNLRAYCASKSLARAAIRPMTYEHSPQGIWERNTPTASSQKTLTQTAFAEMLRDSRMGTLAVQQAKLLTDIGGDFCYFELASRASASAVGAQGVWGAMDTILDTTQEPYASIAAYLANPPTPVRSPPKLGLLT